MNDGSSDLLLFLYTALQHTIFLDFFIFNYTCLAEEMSPQKIFLLSMIPPPSSFGSDCTFVTPLGLGLGLAVKLSAVFFHDESSITIRGRIRQCNSALFCQMLALLFNQFHKSAQNFDPENVSSSSSQLCKLQIF